MLEVMTDFYFLFFKKKVMTELRMINCFSIIYKKSYIYAYGRSFDFS